MRRPASVLLALGLLLPLTGCPQRVHVWLNERPTTQHLVFYIGRERGERGGVAAALLRVDRCDQAADYSNRPVWMVSLQRGPDDLDSVTYGRVPGRFEQSGAAPTLTPGCYQATTDGSPGRIRFDVVGDGNIRERPEGQ